jgi:hypothetical protein
VKKPLQPSRFEKLVYQRVQQLQEREQESSLSTRMKSTESAVTPQQMSGDETEGKRLSPQQSEEVIKQLELYLNQIKRHSELPSSVSEAKKNEIPMAESNNQRKLMSITRLATVVLVLAVLGLFAVYVWPTRYRYDHMSFPGDVGTYPVRIDRFSGEVEVLRPMGWRSLGSATPNARPAASP